MAPPSSSLLPTLLPLPALTTPLATPRRSSLPFYCSLRLLPRRGRTPSHLRSKPFFPSQYPSSSSSSSPLPDPNRLELTLDLPNFLPCLRRSSLSLLSSVSDASRDLLTSVSFDRTQRRLAFSCRRSSLLLLGMVLAWAIAAAWMWPRAGSAAGGSQRVVRRDRSLGGREVVVGWEGGTRGWRGPVEAEVGMRRGMVVEKREERVPEWWPVAVASMEKEVDARAQRAADALVRAITDDRMNGMDYREDDIIQLRHICRTSGASVSFGTANTRGSFYRAAIDFVLNTCIRASPSDVPVKINGEEVRHFVAGLAENIRLNSIRAAVILRAAVAAKARAYFLQAWALDIRGKRTEALEELSKICRIIQMFPPDEQSPEIEMVAGGLEKNLKVEQRKHLYKLLKEVCGLEETHRTVAAALGLEGQDEARW